MILKDFMWEEYVAFKNKPSYIECESEIKTCLFAVVEVLNKAIRESEDFSNKMLIQISNAADDTNVGLQKLSEYMDSNFGKLSADNQAILEILKMILKQNQVDSARNKEKRHPVKSRTQEYANKWEANMFLNDFSEWDEKAGVNVKLKDVYIDEHLPHFIWGENEKESNNLRDLLSKYTSKRDENRMLLILGQPGIGKSTLITWITANFNEHLERILVYKFAEDLKNIDWQKSNISIELLDALKLSYNDLRGKVLILDGFDEVNIGVDRREILDNLYGGLIYKKNIEGFSLIITCRENYIQEFERLKCRYITLQPWDESQIKSFCDTFPSSEVPEDTIKKLFDNKEILGIPLILYMVLALNISINKESSIVDVYDKIFSLEGGIYDRCIDEKQFDDVHRISEIKKQIHQISREIAFWMFENNSYGAYIFREEYEKICEKMAKGEENIKWDYLIGNYFKLVKHCEGIGTEQIYFVHRSIYEYFVIENIYSSIENSMLCLTSDSQEELAESIAAFIKEGYLSATMCEYLGYKIKRLYDTRLKAKDQKRFYHWWEKTIFMMMENGMFFYTKKSIHNFQRIISQEVTCFCNLANIQRNISRISGKNYIFYYSNKSEIERYIKISCIEHNPELFTVV